MTLRIIERLIYNYILKLFIGFLSVGRIRDLGGCKCRTWLLSLSKRWVLRKSTFTQALVRIEKIFELQLSIIKRRVITVLPIFWGWSTRLFLYGYIVVAIVIIDLAAFYNSWRSELIIKLFKKISVFYWIFSVFFVTYFYDCIGRYIWYWFRNILLTHSFSILQDTHILICESIFTVLPIFASVFNFLAIYLSLRV